MSRELPTHETQLVLFADSDEIADEPEATPGRVALASAAFPTTLGSTTIAYIESQTLLTVPNGFMGPYKFTLNPYSGCGFACEYCYARFFSRTQEEQATWGRWVKVKGNAIELLRKAINARSSNRRLERGDAIYMSSVTDPYQPVEQKLQLTRAILTELIPVQPRLTIQTRSPIAVRDIDLFQKFERIRVNFTITTDSEAVRLRYEPQCPSVEVRLKAATQVAAAGVPIGISISPMLPIRNPEEFGQRLADLDAAEYVTQYFKPTRSRFSAGTSADAIAKMREDAWTEAKYQHTRAVLARCLGPSIRLLEGSEGYAPA